MALSTDAPRQVELRTIRALLFDFAETLFAPETPRQKISGAVHHLGHEPLGASETDRVVALIDRAFASPDYLALRDRQDLSAKEHRAAITFAFAAADTIIEGLSEAMYDRVTEPSCWMPFAETRSTLEALREHGLQIGVVSNIGFDIRPVFAHRALEHLVDTFALSYENGIIKPDPALFEIATTALGVLPSETIMVGDNIADAGAVLAGMRVYLLPPVVPESPRRLGEVVQLCVGRDSNPRGRVPERPIQGERTSIRPATTDDVDLLVRWHLDPEVARYWDGTMYTREEMLEAFTRPDVDAYIVESDEVPVGYLQAWFGGDANAESGLDMFLIPEARGRGLGPDAARTLATWLISTLQLPHLIVDPYLSNPRGIRAWAKAGFEPVGERPADEHHSEAWLLMTFVPHTGHVTMVP